MFDDMVKRMAEYRVVLEPDYDIPEWWAGAPSVTICADGLFYLAVRMRHGDSPKGQRGYETRILRSKDGLRFEPIHRLTREAAGIGGFERPALVRDPFSGRYKLYTCAGLERGWAILKFDDADHPSRFDPASLRPVLCAEYPDDGTDHIHGYKDPFLYHDGRLWHLFVIGCDRVERPYRFVSEDGEQWRPAQPRPLLDNSGWHNFYTRPACLLPMAVGYLLVYEGSNLGWYDPVYNIATGLAYTPDLKTYHDLTPREPLFTSTTPGPYHTWRYSHWLRVDKRIFVYFEAARPNKTNELRLGVFDALA